MFKAISACLDNLRGLFHLLIRCVQGLEVKAHSKARESSSDMTECLAWMGPGYAVCIGLKPSLETSIGMQANHNLS